MHHHPGALVEVLVYAVQQLPEKVVAGDPLVGHGHMDGPVGAGIGQPPGVTGKPHGDLRVGQQAHHDIGADVFEGRDAAGKGGVIKRITQHLSPRLCRVVALPAPTERERTQWYFQRYVAHLPAAGEMVLFDRSWYNRAGVERVMGFCTEEEHREFLRSCPEFERMLVRSGIKLVKYWFSVSDEEQERRFWSRIDAPHKRWKLSPMDLESRRRWVEYSRAKDEMFAHTDIKQAPWYVVDADLKKRARLNCIRHLLGLLPYEDLTPEPIDLPHRAEAGAYVRPPMSDQTFVPDEYP